MQVNYQNIEKGEVIVCTILNKLRGKTAQDILKEYWKEDVVPVNIKLILERIGISYEKSDFKDLCENVGSIKAEITRRKEQNKSTQIDGVVFASKEEGHDFLNIFYRKNKFEGMSPEDAIHAEHRARFTLAHELAHCCQSSEDVQNGKIEGLFIDFRFSEDFMEENEKERRANEFAGELLIPLDKLLEILKKFPDMPVSLLSEHFHVSKRVMSARLRALGLGR